MKKYMIILSLVAMVFATGCKKEKIAGTLNGHDYVDLGLPSGTMWATCNVGANSPEEYGDYYAWGEVVTKATYLPSNYMYSGTSEILPLSADAAAVNWGEGWRMPSYQQWYELLTYCSNEQTYGKGITFTGTNGNSIFLPAVGFRYDDVYDTGSDGRYWSSSLYTDNPNNAWFFNLIPHYFCMKSDGRSGGLAVRPVCIP